MAATSQSQLLCKMLVGLLSQSKRGRGGLGPWQGWGQRKVQHHSNRCHSYNFYYGNKVRVQKYSCFIISIIMSLCLKTKSGD